MLIVTIIIFGLIDHDSPVSIFANITLINFLFLDQRASIAGVLWTIPVEFFYYLVVPTIFKLISNKGKQIITLIILITIAITLFSYRGNILPYFHQIIPDTLALDYSAERYAFTYALGIGLFFYLKNKRIPEFNSIYLIILFILLVLYILIGVDPSSFAVIIVSIWTSALIYISISRQNLTKLLFENKFILFIGKISFSFYLIHTLIIRFLGNYFHTWQLLFASLILTIIIGTLTFELIEKPFISLTKKLN